MTNHRLSGLLLILFASLIFGAMPSLIMGAYAGGISVLTMQSLKYITVSAILIPFSIKLYSLHRLPKAVIAKLIVTSGVLYAAQASLYAYAVTIMPVSVSALLLFTYPLLVSLISAAFGWEKLTPTGVLLLLLSFIGLIFMFAKGWQEISLLGVGCSLLAALSYSIYVVVVGRLGIDLPAPVINTLVNAGPAVSLTIIAVLSGSFSLAFAPACWGYVLLNAVGSGIFAYTMWFVGMKRLGAMTASVLSMTEPLFAALVSLLLLGQRMTSFELLGGLVLLTGTTAFSYLRDSKVKKGATA